MSAPVSVVVACCQLAPEVGRPERNREAIRSAVARAADAGARVIVLPELAASGYVFHDHAELAACAEPVDGPALRMLHELAIDHDAIIVCGFAEAADHAVYNSAALVDATGVRSVYRKAHLWDTEKTNGFTAGDEPPTVVDTASGRIAVMICYDLEFPEWVRTAALKGADLLCAPVNWPLYPRPAGERPAEIVKVQAGAAVNRMAIAIADRTGTERGQDWVGGSAVVDQDGYPVTEFQLGAEAVLVGSLDVSQSRVKTISEHNDVFRDRRPELYGLVHQEVEQ